jgi:acetyl-CoA synthetase
MLPNPQDARDFERIAAAFSWDLPERYNIGVDVCDKWSHEPNRVALIHKPPVGENLEYTFVEIRRLSNQAANLSVRH